ncbi:hypothetical protein DVH24_035700 [Malus domestica]|uniref:Uncharacterized protein n=1 Tax=Malus domestica TaxID=3750 RepID=A0A498JU13_MALDO|nr:hypothetical protein DVH24_035700 [Malus domestica]
MTNDNWSSMKNLSKFLVHFYIVTKHIVRDHILFTSWKYVKWCYAKFYDYKKVIDIIAKVQGQLHDIVCFGPRPRPHGFVSGNLHENFPVGHPSWECSRVNSLNFVVPMEPKVSELPKGLVLGRDGNIHIRLIGSTPLGNVGCHNPPP